MSKQNEPPLMLELQPSDRLQQAMMILHLFACVAGIANSLAMPIKLVLCVAVCVNLGFIIKRLSSQHYKIRYSQQLGWEIAHLDGFTPVRILKSTVITTFVIILDVKPQNKDKTTLLVVSDALCADDYRQFIVKLKITVKNE